MRVFGLLGFGSGAGRFNGAGAQEHPLRRKSQTSAFNGVFETRFHSGVIRLTRKVVGEDVLRKASLFPQVSQPAFVRIPGGEVGNGAGHDGSCNLVGNAQGLKPFQGRNKPGQELRYGLSEIASNSLGVFEGV